MFLTKERMWKSEKVAYGINVTMYTLLDPEALKSIVLTRDWLANEKEGSKDQVLNILRFLS